ncbi:MAG: Rieske 2Fe-2S domain-containing protein [Acidobacteriota bacterium]|nr:Rieske 2Fe-2S domain-containing protein [Acidobacteriota bacterium]
MSNEAIFEVIGKQKWLEAASDPLSKAIRNAFTGDAGRAIKNALHGTWFGHPLHPALVAIPVGAWTVAMVLDALDSLSGRDELGAGADAAVAIGLIGAVGAAITGATDWSETDGRGKTIGLLHGLLNVGATALYTTSFFMRKRRKQRSKAVALSMLGFAIASGSAYLGGHLVFGEQIGVDHTATPDATKPEKFRVAIAADKLPENTPTRVTVGETPIVLVKRGDRIFALSATCPHLGGPLDEGKLVGDAIQCPWHGSELALADGHVVNGPTTFPARCYDVRVRAGKVEVRSASKAK